MATVIPCVIKCRKLNASNKKKSKTKKKPCELKLTVLVE